MNSSSRTSHELNRSPLRVAICDSLPLVAEGLQSVVARIEGFSPGPLANSLREAEYLLESGAADLLVIDAGFGEEGVVLLSDLARSHGVHVVITGFSISIGGTLRYLGAGARGFIRKDATPTDVEACLCAVAAGKTWTKPNVPATTVRTRVGLASLTARERQVLTLVEQGWKNKSIAEKLAIGVGTVKIHVRHIFEKTGLRDRVALRLHWSADCLPLDAFGGYPLAGAKTEQSERRMAFSERNACS